jgi:hypothetical protein
MNCNVSYLVIGALAVVAVVFGYQLYQERQKTTGVEISVGDRGISIGKKQSGIFLMAPSKGAPRESRSSASTLRYPIFS